jgi:TatD DNase family protein
LSLIDIGANLLDQKLYKNFDSGIQKSKDNNLKKIIITSSCIEDTHAAKVLIDKEPDLLYTTVGFHPHNAKDYNDNHYDEMLKLCNLGYVKAIGECGLDYKRNYSSKIDQIYCFKKHLDLACEINMPMFLHERDAHQDFLILLKEYINKIEDVVVHCFTGDKQSLKKYLDLDCYIGITGWITDPKRGYHLHDIIKYIPSNKLMIETDSPYLMPYNFDIKNKKYNEPSNLIYILETISNILKKDKSLLTKEIYNNTCKFFNIYDK